MLTQQSVEENPLTDSEVLDEVITFYLVSFYATNIKLKMKSKV